MPSFEQSINKNQTLNELIGKSNTDKNKDAHNQLKQYIENVEQSIFWNNLEINLKVRALSAYLRDCVHSGEFDEARNTELFNYIKSQNHCIHPTILVQVLSYFMYQFHKTSHVDNFNYTRQLLIDTLEENGEEANGEISTPAVIQGLTAIVMNSQADQKKQFIYTQRLWGIVEDPKKNKISLDTLISALTAVVVNS